MRPGYFIRERRRSSYLAEALFGSWTRGDLLQKQRQPPNCCRNGWSPRRRSSWKTRHGIPARTPSSAAKSRSEEHTSELQSLRHLVCRLLLEKKKRQNNAIAD